MSLPAIEVSGLAKRYVIEHESRHDSLRDTLHHAARKLWRRARWGTGFATEEFWALRDVSFAVSPGEVVAVIGRNGAGKSTLLKILSRITEPTAGRVTLRGRVASLLEVGTGFHPDLTGRENIFLNGAILGMSRAEIRAKFDEIVAFAEVERFLDTPVKRYSSGMYVRLAFAVAAHLEPEILIVDEVLAVGDQQFQDKCLRKIRSVAQGGRTVLFVSHNLSAIQSLCSRIVTLRQGEVQFDGNPAEAISHYLAAGRPAAGPSGLVFVGNNPAMAITRVACNFDPIHPAIDIDLTLRCATPLRLGIEFLLSTPSGVPVAFAQAGSLNPASLLTLATGDAPTSWRIDVSRLANGPYLLAIQLVDPGIGVHLRHEHETALELCRPPAPPALRVLEQAWQAGCVEIDVHRQA